MSVQTRPQAFLIEVMGNQTDASAQYEKSVKNSHAKVFFGFFGAESTAVTKKVNEADGDATIDVEDKVIFLGGSDSLDSDGVVEHGALGEVGFDKVLDEFDTEIGIVS